MEISPKPNGAKVALGFPLRPVLLSVSLLLIGGLGGMMLSRTYVPGPDGSEDRGIRGNPGPWGEFYYVPFTISAPEEALPVRSVEAHGTHWFFKHHTRGDLAKLFDSENIPSGIRDELLDPTRLEEKAEGITVSPTAGALLNLPDDARKRIYRLLGQIPENRTEILLIHKSTLKDRFGGRGISEETRRLFRKLSCEHGDYLVFSGLATLLTQLRTYEEKAQFLKGITLQQTMLLRIHATPRSDVAALANYWGKGSKSTDVRTIFQSLSKIPVGTWVNIVMVLPSVPASELYEYPVAPDNPLAGPAHARDCHWTTFNFFRDPPQLEVTPEDLIKELKEHYAPAVGDPRYGDVLLLSTSQGEIIHSCVYIADNIVYTKNGSTAISPWLLEQLPDLLSQYYFMAPEGESLKISSYRNKQF